MYEIRPETLKTFIEDNNIKLPRFQRKQTWDDKKNFELIISLFKEYPIGVSILNLEDQNGMTTRWLLDGRQRRNALIKFYEDPENVYVWAKKYLSLKGSDQLQDVDEKFWEKINEYLEINEEIDDIAEPQNISSDNNSDNNDLVLEENNDEEPKYESSKKGLDLLLHIIKISHTKNHRKSGFTSPFDFSKEIEKLAYVSIDNKGNKTLNSKRLKTFITNYKTYCSDESLNFKESDSFKQFMSSLYSYNESTGKVIENKINNKWAYIVERIEILDKITNIFLHSKIGLIEVKNLSSIDSQTIFNIINSKGTKLSAVEILSAKPSWNIPIKNINSDQKKAVINLYKKINVQNEDFVKWDLPATFISRLKYTNLFFKNFTDSDTDFSKKITLGFKMLSGIEEGGVKKDDIDALGKNKDIQWDTFYESKVNDFNNMHKIILSFDYFKYLNSWEFSLSNNLSDAISLNFNLIAYKDWSREGQPIGTDFKTKKFQKNCFILLDSLIYEYVNRVWRGSSDSKIASNIANFNKNSEDIEPLDKSKWETLLNEVFQKQSINGDKVTQDIMEPLLYHFYAIAKIAAPSNPYGHGIEVDHIIPQTLFLNSRLPNKEALMNSLFNLALLPKGDNVSKSNKRLIEITDQWLKDQIVNYAFVNQNDFAKFSDISNYQELKQQREEKFLDVFTKGRESLLLN